MKYFLLLVLFYFIKCLTPLILVSADDNYKCSKISSGDNHLGNTDQSNYIKFIITSIINHILII